MSFIEFFHEILYINIFFIFSFDERDESSLDMSFKRSIMTADELRAELRERDMIIQILTDTVRQKELEILDKEKLLRQEITMSIGTARDTERKHYEQQKEIMESYHNKKVSEECE